MASWKRLCYIVECQRFVLSTGLWFKLEDRTVGT